MQHGLNTLYKENYNKLDHFTVNDQERNNSSQRGKRMLKKTKENKNNN